MATDRNARGYAVQCLDDARAALRQVSHNHVPEWLNDLERWKKAVAATEQAIAEIDAE